MNTNQLLNPMSIDNKIFHLKKAKTFVKHIVLNLLEEEWTYTFLYTNVYNVYNVVNSFIQMN